MLIKKVILFLVLATVVALTANMTLSYFEPQVSMNLAVQQTKLDSSGAQAALRAYTQLQRALYAIPALIIIGSFLLIFRKDLGRLLKKAQDVAKETAGAASKPLLLLVALSLLVMPLAGCMKPFNTPE